MKNLIVLPIMIMLLCSGCKYFKKQKEEPAEIVSADTSEPQNTDDSSAYYTTEPADPIEQSTVENTSAQGKYYMIVGCFKVDANADRYAEKIRSMGYNVQVLPGMNDFEMVAASSYNSYRESVSELEKFRNEITPNAWVYLQR
jgi:cell division septation protein DedD